MNGPRTNQFVAPTSFITSISRRREKIESRIVFAIRSAAEVSRMTIAIEKTISTPVREVEDAAGVALAVDDRVDAGGQRVHEARVELLDVVGVLRRDLERVGERVVGQRRGRARARCFFICSSACSLRDERRSGRRAGSTESCGATAFSSAGVAWPPLLALVLKSTCTSSSRLTWSDQETVQVPSAISSPSRNMPISTVIIAAKVVERFAPRLRQASETSRRELHSPL